MTETVHTKIPRAAFFDLDRTLIPGSSLFLLARGAYERDMFRVHDLLRFAWSQAMFRLHGEQQENMDRSRESTLDFVTGRSRRELLGWGRQIAEEKILPLVYEDIVKVIEEHKSRGDLTFLITAAPIELAESIAQELGMTAALGTVAEVDQHGFYTGRLVGPPMHGAEKSKAAAEIAGDRTLDLQECHAYSDSINDLPLLESVGFPHAVNPERELLRIAQARGWPVHELRARRKALLVGVPAGLGGITVFAGGVALGTYLERQRHKKKPRAIERFAKRLGL